MTVEPNLEQYEVIDRENSEQVSQGHLNGSSQSELENGNFESRGYGIVPIDLIIQINHVSDFSLSRYIDHPRVLKSSEKYYALDNFQYIEIRWS